MNGLRSASITVVAMLGMWSAAASANLSVSPTSVDFRTVVIGDTATATVTLSSAKGNKRRPGTDYNILAASVGGNSAFSILSDSCMGMLPAGSRCTIELQFRPAVVGTVTGVLFINAIATDGTPVNEQVALTGTGDEGGGPPPPPGFLSVSPTSLSFLAKCNYEQASPQLVLVRNSGGQSITFQGVNLKSRDFSQSSGNCPSAGSLLAPSQSCAITVSYTNIRKGTKTAEMTVSASSNSEVVSLTGTCTDSFSP